MKSIIFGLLFLSAGPAFAKVSKVVYEQNFEELSQIYDYHESNSKLKSSWYQLNTELSKENTILTTSYTNKEDEVVELERKNDGKKSALHPDFLGMTVNSMRTSMQSVVVNYDFSWRKSSETLTFPKNSGFSISRENMESLFLEALFEKLYLQGEKFSHQYGLSRICGEVVFSEMDCFAMNEKTFLCSMDFLTTKVLATDKKSCPSAMMQLN
ncbi:hypothetical protein HBN50_03440 [Halobacteriovorax sp. GB3]|uniref:hypothetical protein n=1 Tax=Halobacteriovorax sp. GB3 TaxID=2719615 RepID=UPI0023625C18|nr:hypothetical protein [Halobacteriovorax sp. GB3]MDD0852131.1 hypothetical protein [Halobacteriovorax sp. GB3]